MFKQEKGVTLIALVITIIILLILAGVSIAMLTGDNGVLTKSQKAKEESIKAEVKDKVMMAINEILVNDADVTQVQTGTSHVKEATALNVALVVNSNENGVAIPTKIPTTITAFTDATTPVTAVEEPTAAGKSGTLTYTYATGKTCTVNLTAKASGSSSFVVTGVDSVDL